MIGFKSNCKDCDKRYPGCHDHCESYLKAKAEYDKKVVAINNKTTKVFGYDFMPSIKS